MPTRSAAANRGRRRRPARHRLLLAAALGAGLLMPAATPATAASAKRPKVVCKAGTIPQVTGSGAKARLKLKKGKAACVKPPKAKVTQIEPAAATQQGTIASTTDQLTQALTVNPDAFAKVEQKLGSKATKALIAQGMSGWRAGARASARRLGDDGYHYNGSFGDAAKGTKGSAKLDAGPAGEGGQGVAATATIEFTADGKGLQTLGADKVTDAKSAGVKIEISFEDAPAACPTAAGKVKGTLKAKASLTITTDGATQTMSAEVNASYELTVGADAHWKTIDNVNVQTTFTFGGSGKGTETWRGQRGGSGFGARGIFGEGSGDFTSAVAEQQSHIDPNVGGVWGPRGRVLFSDPSTDNIFNYGGSIAHLKGMILTDIATTYLTYAAVEYIRHVVATRGEKHWYDDEACLKLEGKPDKAKLGPGETATVTTKNAKAADGTPVAVNQSGTGSASLTPGSAAMAAGGTTDFTLTAPGTRPVKATWKVVALSPAGKKTLQGSLADQPLYTITLDDHESLVVSGSGYDYVADGDLDGTLSTAAIEGSNPFQSGAGGPLTWSNLTASTTVEYSGLINPVIVGGAWSALVTSKEDGTISVAIDFTGSTKVTWTFWNDEPPEPGGYDPPRVDIPGSVGPMTVALWNQPLVFTFPAEGGGATYDRDFLSEGNGFRSKGSLTVAPGGSG